MIISPYTNLQGMARRADHPKTDLNQWAAPMILALGAILCLLTSGATLSMNAQSEDVQAVPVAGSAAMLNVIRWNGSLPEAAGRTVEIEFALYQDQAGGLALWNETQTVKVGADGKYSVLLGATSVEGVPAALFSAGVARWIEARPEGPASRETAAVAPRSLLAAVPYAFKAADSETLAGRAASDYVTREDLQSAVAADLRSPVGVHPEVNPTGSGTTDYVPLWTGTSTLGNSVIFESGTKIGIDNASPTSTLDLIGTSALRGAVSVIPTTVATSAAGVNSPVLGITASAFQSGASAVNQNFGLQVQYVGNNTATPGGQVSLLHSTGAGSWANTGLYLESSGSIATGGYVAVTAPAATAAAGGNSQKLQMEAQAFNSSSSKSVVQTFGFGAVAAGNNTTSPSANMDLMFASGSTVPTPTGLSFAPSGKITFAAGQTFPGTGPGTITGVTATSPITGGGTSGSVSVGLNTSALETTLDGRYAKLSGGNIFSSYQEAYQTAGPGNAALLAWGTKGSVGAFGDSDTGYGVQGESTSGHGVYAQVTSPVGGSTGVLGFTGNAFSSTYSSEAGIANAGIWADNSKAGSGVPLALIATGDDVYGAAIITNGADYPALFADNSGGTAIRATAANGYGVSASAATGTGVYGSTNGGGDGVEGFASALGEDDAGVLGVGNKTSVTYGMYNIYSGVWGDTGTSTTSVAPAWAIGVLGTADDSHAGVFLNDSSSWSTMYISNASSGGTGLFRTLMAVDKDGACGIGSGGSLTCTGQIKTLASTGGGTRKVETYAVQSPENWMEDFGSGQLKRGTAVIAIDPAFAETVSESADYHVFLTPRGDSKGLYVINATARSFEVRESGGGTSSLSFDYRIVGKRRGYETQRLIDVTERFNAESAAALPRPHEGAVRHAPPLPARSPLIPLHPGPPRSAPVQMRHPTPDRAIAQATPEAKH